MADFVAVLKKTLDGLGETTPEIRSRVYDKARATIAAKLAAIDPPPPAAMAERQKRALEDAIATVERGYAKGPAPDPLAELENIFSSIDRNRTQTSHSRPPARAEPASPTPPPPAPPAPPVARREEPVHDEAFSPLLPDDVADKQAGAAAPVRQEAPAPEAPKVPEQAASEWVVPDHMTAGHAQPQPAAGEPVDETEPGPLAGDMGTNAEPFRDDDAPERKRGYGRLAAAAIAVLLVAGGGYLWLARDGQKEPAAPVDTAAGTPAPETRPEPAPEPEPAKETAAAPPAAPANDAASEPEQPAKFTQRLLPDGKEVDPGPAGGESSIGEGTSIVALTTQPPPAAPAQQDPAAPQEGQAAAPGGTAAAPPTAQAQQALPVGQKAIFYEERTSAAEGSAEPGSIVWSLVQESPGGDAPPEPAIRAEATIPGKNVQLRMTIRRNADQTLPASHIIEMIFLTPDGFEGGGIENVLRIAMKGTEQEAGNPLIGIPAKIADGFFLVALNDTKADEDANLTLLRKQDWIDIPVVYKSGRRALLTMEKGIPGEKVFDEALKVWQAKTAG